MFQFLLVVHIIVGVAMVGVILMQRSEGGGLAGGGSPSGLMSARGAADFLTRTTAILAGAFVILSIGLAALATVNRTPAKLDESLVTQQPGAVPGSPAPAPGAVPMAGQPAPLTPPATAPSPATSAVPLATPDRPAARVEREPTPSTARPRQAAPAATTPAAPKASESAVTPPPTPVIVPTSPAAPPPGDGPQ